MTRKLAFIKTHKIRILARFESIINNGYILRSVLDDASESFKQTIIKKSREDGYYASEKGIDEIIIKGNKPINTREIIEYAFNQAIESGKLIMQRENISQEPKNTLSETHTNRRGVVLDAAQIEEAMCLSSEKQPQLASTPKKSDACNSIAVDNKDQKSQHNILKAVWKA